jgi:hypothetical protein
MHCLEVIIARNERAAAREEAHADTDWDADLAAAICYADPVTDEHSTNYQRAYERARQEG